METFNQSEKRSRDTEKALAETILQKRQECINDLLYLLGFQEIEAQHYTQLEILLEAYEKKQHHLLRAYEYEKTLNDHFFNVLYE